MIGYGFKRITGDAATRPNNLLAMEVAAWNAMIIAMWSTAAAAGPLVIWSVLR